MNEFPQKTLFQKVIPKNKFYERTTISQEVKKCFVQEISSIVWRNKLSEATVNVQ